MLEERPPRWLNQHSCPLGHSRMGSPRGWPLRRTRRGTVVHDDDDGDNDADRDDDGAGADGLDAMGLDAIGSGAEDFGVDGLGVEGADGGAD